MWIWGVEVSSSIANRSACHTNSGRSYNFPTWFNGPNMVLTSPTVSEVPNIWHVPTLVLSKYLLQLLDIYLPLPRYLLGCTHLTSHQLLWCSLFTLRWSDALVRGSNYHNGAINNIQQQTGSLCHVPTCHVQVWTRVKCPRLNTFLCSLTFILH